MLILLNHEHNICFHLSVSSISSFSVLWFSEYRSFTPLVKFICRYFSLLFDTTVSGIVFLDFLFDSSLLVDENVTDVLFFSFSFSHSFIVVQGQLSPFPPHHSPLPQPSPLPTLDPNPLCLCPSFLYTYSLMTLPLFPSVSAPLSLLVTVNFFISISLVIFCLLVCFVD